MTAPESSLVPSPRPPMVPATAPLRMGEVLRPDTLDPAGEEFWLAPDQVGVHMAVLGNSGSGKSKFLELLLRQRLLAGRPFALWDPHGDLTKSLLAFVAARKALGDDALWRTVHSLSLDADLVFAYDPVLHAPRRGAVGDAVYFQWMKTRIDRLVRAVLRRLPETAQDVVVRLKRWIKTILWACLVALDDDNTHVGLDKALVFTDPQDPEFESLYARVSPHLPRRYRRNFEKLIGVKRAQDQEKWVESTINKLEECLSPLTELVYGQRRRPVDVRGIVRRGEFLLIDLKEGEYFSHEEKVTLGGFLLVDVMAAKEAEDGVPEDEREEYMVVIDEAGELLGEDLKRWLRSTRKYRCPIVLGAQGLASLARGDVDVAADVLTNCGTVVCFQNTWRDDKEALADRMWAGNIDFTPRTVEVQRQRGFLQFLVDELSESYSRQHARSRSTTLGEGRAHAVAVGEALALTRQWSEGRVDARGVARREDQEVDTNSKNQSLSRQEGGATAATKNKTATDTDSTSRAETEGQTDTTGESITVAHKLLLATNTVSEFERDGSLAAGPVAQQEERHQQLLHTLPVGVAAVAARGRDRAFLARIDPVLEWWPTGREKYEAVRRLRSRLAALHGYAFSPADATGVHAVRRPRALPSAAPANASHVPRAASPFDDD